MSRHTLIVAALGIVGLVAAWLYLRATDPIEPDAAAQTETAGEHDPARRADRSTVDAAHVPSARITGRVVTDADDAPVVGAVVSVTPHDEDPGADAGPLTAKTDAGGGFTIEGLAEGEFAVSATMDGFLPAVARRVAATTEGSAEPVVLRLQSGGHRLYGEIADITGGPIEGAMVRAVPLQGFVELRRLDGFGTMSDDGGGYALQVLPGRYRVEVRHPDYAPLQRTVEIGAGDREQDFELVPTGVIEGIVVDGTTAEPVAGALVSWSREQHMTIAPGQRITTRGGGGVVRAGEDGRFRVGGLQPGLVMLRARAGARASAEPMAIPVAFAEHVDGVELRLSPAHTVSGRVVRRGEPDAGIGGARVTLSGRTAERAETVADAEGRFELQGVVPGQYQVMAEADGYLPAMPGSSITVDGDADDVVVELDPGLTIEGRVEPAEEAEVAIEIRPENIHIGAGMLSLGGGRSVTTDEEGRFSLGPVRPGPTTVAARTPYGRAGEADVEVGPDGARDVVIVLEDRTTVRGKVLDTDGEPIADATVNLTPHRAGVEVRVTVNGRNMLGRSASTAEDGSYVIDGLSGGTHEVTVTDAYGEPLPIRSGAVANAGVRTLAVPERGELTADLIVDAPDGVIDGTVVTADGEPAPDVWVRATALPEMPRPESADDEGPGERREMRMIFAGSDGTTGARTRPPVLTDAEGRFRFSGLREADYEIVAEAGGGTQRTTVVAKPDKTVRLQLAPLATIEGRVTVDSEPARDVVVSVEGPASRTVHARDGSFEIDRLDPGRYRVQAMAGAGTGSTTVDVEPGQTKQAVIALERLATVKGRLVDKAGQPIAGAMVIIGEGEQGRVEVSRSGGEPPPSTDAEGRFELTCAAGKRVLLAMDPKNPRPIAMQFFVAEPGQTHDLGDVAERDLPDPGQGM